MLSVLFISVALRMSASINVLPQSQIRSVFPKLRMAYRLHSSVDWVVGVQPSWRMNELRAETRQSIDAIKKVLDGIAVQITRGPTRGEFELRSEYKTAGAVPT